MDSSITPTAPAPAPPKNKNHLVPPAMAMTMLSPHTHRRSSPCPGGLTNANANADGDKGPCLCNPTTNYATPQQINQWKYDVNGSEQQQQQQQQQQVAYRYPYHYHAHHHPTPTTQAQDQQQHPQPQPYHHRQHNSNYNYNRNSYHYQDPASAWPWHHYQPHPHPPSSPHWHGDFEVMTDDVKPQPQVYQQGSSQSQFFPHSPSRGYSYSYPYHYQTKYQQPQAHSQTNDMSPLIAGEGVYMEPHSQSSVLTRARADSSPRYVDKYYTNSAPESTPANADTDSAPPLTQARAQAQAQAQAQARVDSHSKNEDHSEAEDVDGDGDTITGPAPGSTQASPAGVGVVDGACTFGCSQFLPNSSRPQQSLPILKPTPSIARVDGERKPAAGRISTIHESSRSRDPVSAETSPPFLPPPPNRRRRRGRHPLSGPGLPSPSDNSSTIVSCFSSSSSKSSESKHGLVWEQKIHELVSLRTLYNMFSSYI